MCASLAIFHDDDEDITENAFLQSVQARSDIMAIISMTAQQNALAQVPPAEGLGASCSGSPAVLATAALDPGSCSPGSPAAAAAAAGDTPMRLEGTFFIAVPSTASLNAAGLVGPFADSFLASHLMRAISQPGAPAGTPQRYRTLNGRVVSLSEDGSHFELSPEHGFSSDRRVRILFDESFYGSLDIDPDMLALLPAGVDPENALLYQAVCVADVFDTCQSSLLLGDQRPGAEPFPLNPPEAVDFLRLPGHPGSMADGHGQPGLGVDPPALDGPDLSRTPSFTHISPGPRLTESSFDFPASSSSSSSSPALVTGPGPGGGAGGGPGAGPAGALPEPPTTRDPAGPSPLALSMLPATGGNVAEGLAAARTMARGAPAAGDAWIEVGAPPPGPDIGRLSLRRSDSLSVRPRATGRLSVTSGPAPGFGIRRSSSVSGRLYTAPGPGDPADAPESELPAVAGFPFGSRLVYIPPRKSYPDCRQFLMGTSDNTEALELISALLIEFHHLFENVIASITGGRSDSDLVFHFLSSMSSSEDGPAAGMGANAGAGGRRGSGQADGPGSPGGPGASLGGAPVAGSSRTAHGSPASSGHARSGSSSSRLSSFLSRFSSPTGSMSPTPAGSPVVGAGAGAGAGAGRPPRAMSSPGSGRPSLRVATTPSPGPGRSSSADATSPVAAVTAAAAAAAAAAAPPLSPAVGVIRSPFGGGGHFQPAAEPQRPGPGHQRSGSAHRIPGTPVSIASRPVLAPALGTEALHSTSPPVVVDLLEQDPVPVWQPHGPPMPKPPAAIDDFDLIPQELCGQLAQSVHAAMVYLECTNPLFAEMASFLPGALLRPGGPGGARPAAAEAAALNAPGALAAGGGRLAPLLTGDLALDDPVPVAFVARQMVRNWTRLLHMVETYILGQTHTLVFLSLTIRLDSQEAYLVRCFQRLQALPLAFFLRPDLGPGSAAAQAAGPPAEVSACRPMSREERLLHSVATDILGKLDNFKSPSDKMFVIQTTFEAILKCFNAVHPGLPMGADDLVPRMAYVLIHSGLTHVYADLTFIGQLNRIATRFASAVDLVSDGQVQARARELLLGHKVAQLFGPGPEAFAQGPALGPGSPSPGAHTGGTARRSASQWSISSMAGSAGSPAAFRRSVSIEQGVGAAGGPAAGAGAGADGLAPGSGSGPAPPPAFGANLRDRVHALRAEAATQLAEEDYMLSTLRVVVSLVESLAQQPCLPGLTHQCPCRMEHPTTRMGLPADGGPALGSSAPGPGSSSHAAHRPTEVADLHLIGQFAGYFSSDSLPASGPGSGESSPPRAGAPGPHPPPAAGPGASSSSLGSGSGGSRGLGAGAPGSASSAAADTDLLFQSFLGAVARNDLAAVGRLLLDPPAHRLPAAKPPAGGCSPEALPGAASPEAVLVDSWPTSDFSDISSADGSPLGGEGLFTELLEEGDESDEAAGPAGPPAERLAVPLSRHAPMLVNLFDERGYTSLQHAASRGHRDMVELLLYCGAAINYPTLQGMTPLHFAAQYGQLPVVCALLRRAAHVRPATPQPLGPGKQLHWGPLPGSLAQEVRAAFGLPGPGPGGAPSRGQAELWVEAPAGTAIAPGPEPAGCTVIRPASAVLNVDARDASGASALHLAASNGHPAIIRALYAALLHGVALAEGDPALAAAGDLAGRLSQHPSTDRAVIRAAMQAAMCCGVPAELHPGYDACTPSPGDCAAVPRNLRGDTPLHMAVRWSSPLTVAEVLRPFNCMSRCAVELGIAQAPGPAGLAGPGAAPQLGFGGVLAATRGTLDTPMHIAPDFPVALVLLVGGASTLSKNRIGYTPLHSAARAARHGVVELLGSPARIVTFVEGLSVSLGDIGRPVRLAAARADVPLEQLVDLSQAPKLLRPPTRAEDISSLPVPPCQAGCLLTPLTLQLLHEPDFSGMTALHLGVLKKEPAMVSFLLTVDRTLIAQSGTDVPPLHSRRTFQEEDTPLHLAAALSSLQLVEILLRAEASPRIYNRQRLLPMDMSRSTDLQNRLSVPRTF
ncbi:hypothetical protein H696_05968 [Fonticula alba]|uniref:VPS9 domain-containing protein n=1 Tax=Fonticula alba TaxID=691883 RepID=A0A058Z010_FONAL|nr:hypothetical protein H696_05968 [Fonticula alba]KCV67570.1 hypothetical protein H696_05968 [Fonticula alba]|eukprot:XP_009498011.1 hypothetical protein H696_05968 [Fonticula alba]